MKKFIVVCSPPDGGETNFLVEVNSRKEAKEMIDQYINDHQEFELGLSGEYVLTCERYKEGAFVDIDLCANNIAPSNDETFV